MSTTAHEHEANTYRTRTEHVPNTKRTRKTILITNKYFNSNGNKEEKQPLTHYPQGNRTSNYYCKSNP